MSTFSDSLTISIALHEAANVVRQAMIDARLDVQTDTGALIEGREQTTVVSFTWPATISVQLLERGTSTVVQICGKNFGFGPVQSSYVTSRVGGVRNAILVGLERRTAIIASTASQVGVADELRKLADLHSAGTLTDGEFAAAKAALLSKLC